MATESFLQHRQLHSAHAMSRLFVITSKEVEHVITCEITKVSVARYTYPLKVYVKLPLENPVIQINICYYRRTYLVCLVCIQ